MKFNDYVELSVDLNTTPMKKTEEGFLTGTACTEDLVNRNIEEFLDSENVIPDGLCT